MTVEFARDLHQVKRHELGGFAMAFTFTIPVQTPAVDLLLPGVSAKEENDEDENAPVTGLLQQVHAGAGAKLGVALFHLALRLELPSGWRSSISG